jgi:hypothetical protein
MNTTQDGPPRQENFSLIVGGPLYQMWLRSRLLKPPIELLRRRIVFSIVVTWLPLLVLTLLAGTAVTGVEVPFLYNFDVHARLLLAMPLLIAAEVMVHRRMVVTVNQFLVRNIIAREDRERFHEIVTSTMRWRNSRMVELVILVYSSTIGYWVWRQGISLHIGTWYNSTGAAGEQLTAAGWWYAFISLNLFRFLLLRWYYRFILWCVFLWRVSRLPLQLTGLHPDRAGGIGFVGGSVRAFVLLMLAHTVTISGAMADLILHQGAGLPQFQMEILAVIVLLMAAMLLPMTFFVFALNRAKRQGTREYEILAMEYTKEFHSKWILRKAPAEEQLIGSADIQSLADLGNAFEVVRGMRMLPISRNSIISLAVMIALPFVPLVFTMFPVDELVARLVTKIF